MNEWNFNVPFLVYTYGESKIMRKLQCKIPLLFTLIIYIICIWHRNGISFDINQKFYFKNFNHRYCPGLIKYVTTTKILSY